MDGSSGSIGFMHAGNLYPWTLILTVYNTRILSRYQALGEHNLAFVDVCHACFLSGSELSCKICSVVATQSNGAFGRYLSRVDPKLKPSTSQFMHHILGCISHESFCWIFGVPPPSKEVWGLCLECVPSEVLCLDEAKKYPFSALSQSIGGRGEEGSFIDGF